MNYRGRDLDLRTPDRSSAVVGAWPAEVDGPVLVDEAVLACCNHGYDLALAHRAREVRIEHLLNAIEKEAAKAGIVQNVLLEVNIGGEESKTGVAPEALDRQAASANAIVLKASSTAVGNTVLDPST